MIEVIGGDLYQWDISRSVRIKPEQGKQVQKANFSNADIETARVTSAVKDGDYYIADIPDELLKSDQKLTCYAVMIDPDEEKTIEQASFKVNRRNRPDDYDINASTELRSMCDDILGEVVGNTIFDKLAYMKDCLDILYKSPPIKLMREVYGENKSLKELFEYLSETQSQQYAISTSKELIYSISSVANGFDNRYVRRTFPNGEISESGRTFVFPKTFLLPSSSYYDIDNVTCNISVYVHDNSISLQFYNLVDFSEIQFLGDSPKELLENYYGFLFKVFAMSLKGLFLPKVSSLVANTVWLGTAIGNLELPRGLHLGKCVERCYQQWLFGSIEVDPSLQNETPVYCDKDFYVDGTIYLEKLNIPLDCIIGVMENAIYVPEELQEPMLSIGNFNISKIIEYLDSLSDETHEQFEELERRTQSGEITIEQFVEESKELDYVYGVCMEFIELKGWFLQ